MSELPSVDLLLSKYFKTEATELLEKRPELISEIVPICLTDEAPMCWRAAWVLRSVIKENDRRVIPYVDRILEVIPDKKDGHQRELMKLLNHMELSEDQQSVLYDISVTIWESVRKKPSVRYIAFDHIISMVRKYPELKQELEAITLPQYINSLSPGVKAGVIKALSKLEIQVR